MGLGYWYEDKEGELHYKTSGDIYMEGALFVVVGMIIALLCVIILK